MLALKRLKEDRREIFRAASDAQKVADMQLSFHPDYAATLEPEEAPRPLNQVTLASAIQSGGDGPSHGLTR